MINLGNDPVGRLHASLFQYLAHQLLAYRRFRLLGNEEEEVVRLEHPKDACYIARLIELLQLEGLG